MDACVEQAEIVEAQILHEAQRAYTWRYAWGAVNDALAIGSFVGMAAVDRSARATWALSGLASVGSAALTLGLPLDVEYAKWAVYRARALPPCARADKLAALRSAYGHDEAWRVEWPWHVVNFIAGAAVGAAIGFGLHRTTDAVTSALGVVAVGELQLVTQPTALARF